ncbi:MAG: AAA family ATPase [Salinivirgaceae bacterium]|nr:AAA family ATPase [Salinivirgaceae bacterium]
MKEYLEIRNFGPIEKIVLDEIKPFTVFIGESGSGKSTIMKMLAILRWVYKMVNIRSYLKDYSGISKSPFRFNFQTYLKQDGLFGYLRHDTYIHYSRGKCEMEYAKSSFKLISQKIPKNELNLEKISFISEKRNLIPDVLDHNLSVNKKAFYLNEVWNDYIIATENISELNMPFTNVKYQSVKNKQGTKHIIKPIDNDSDDYAIDLESASSGIQSTTPLSLIVEYFTKHYDLIKAMNRSVLSYLSEFDDFSSFKSEIKISDFTNKRVNLFIEEPELSLYPDNQLKLMDFLVDRTIHSKTGKYDITLTISSHSPYIVNYLNVLLLKKEGGIDRNNIAVYRVYDGTIQDLMLRNDRNQIVSVDTRDLSESMKEIYQQYMDLNQERK